MEDSPKKEQTKKEQTKKVKSVNLPTRQIDMITNYAEQKGCSFTDIVSKAVEKFFKDLENGSDSLVESLGIDEPDSSILVPLQLYIKTTNTTFVQVKTMEKKKQLTIKTLTYSSGGTESKTKYVVVTDKHPQYHISKTALLETALDNLNSRMNALEEKLIRNS